jgi:hypothetical protein
LAWARRVNNRVLQLLCGGRLRGELTGSRFGWRYGPLPGRFAPADLMDRKWFPRRSPADGRSLGVMARQYTKHRTGFDAVVSAARSLASDPALGGCGIAGCGFGRARGGEVG